ncbi:MAG: hypothetical protein SVU32_06600, partial [Candidatus Nanohaloarchaea archaeon]|nr:hypothetical protein [Candidatus Nanohaloarchaea archaeon]
MPDESAASRLHSGEDNAAEQYFSNNTLSDLINEYRDLEDEELQEHARSMMRTYVEQSPAGNILDLDPVEAETLFQPEDTGEGYWVGAPAAEDHRGERYLAVRERNPEDRGHTIRLYQQKGDSYEEVKQLTANELGVVSIERAELISDGDELHCYIPVEHGENDWTIDRLQPVKDPADLDPDTRQRVL